MSRLALCVAFALVPALLYAQERDARAARFVIDNGSGQTITLQAPNDGSMTGSWSLALPPTPSVIAGQAMVSDGTGGLSWQTLASNGVPTGYFILGSTSTVPSGFIAAGTYLHENFWTSKGAMTTARSLLVVAAANGKIYAIGGAVPAASAVNEEYDPVTNTWAAKAALPTARYGSAGASVGGKIYVIGGVALGPTISNLNSEYDPSTNTWAAKAVLPTIRPYAAAAVVGGKIYVIGGGNPVGAGTLGTNEEYDPSTNTWAAKTAMPTTRQSLGLAAVGGKLYAMGGFSGTLFLANNEEYDPSTNTWSAKAPMPTARNGLVGAGVNGKAYAIAGFNGNGLSTNEEYDPATDYWTTVAPLPTPRNLAAGTVLGSTIYVIGGDNSSIPGGPERSENEMFTPPVREYLFLRN